MGRLALVENCALVRSCAIVGRLVINTISHAVEGSPAFVRSSSILGIFALVGWVALAMRHTVVGRLALLI